MDRINHIKDLAVPIIYLIFVVSLSGKVWGQAPRPTHSSSELTRPSDSTMRSTGSRGCPLGLPKFEFDPLNLHKGVPKILLRLTTNEEITVLVSVYETKGVDVLWTDRVRSVHYWKKYEIPLSFEKGKLYTIAMAIPCGESPISRGETLEYQFRVN